jgi:hypothetical protein
LKGSFCGIDFSILGQTIGQGIEDLAGGQD